MKKLRFALFLFLFAAPAGWRQVLAATLTVDPSSVPPQASIAATWQDIATPYPNDWLGIYPTGAQDVGGYSNWFYVNCTKGATVAIPAGSCTTTAPAGTGNYEIRLFTANTYTRLAISEFVVTATTQPPTGQFVAIGDCNSPIASLHVCFDGNSANGIYPRGILSDSVDNTPHSTHIGARKAWGSRGGRLALPDGAYIGSFYVEGYDGDNYRGAGYWTWKTDGNAIPGHLGSTAVLAVADYDGGQFEALSIRGKSNDYVSVAAPKDLLISGERVFLPRQAAISQFNFLCIDTAGKVISQESPCR